MFWPLSVLPSVPTNLTPVETFSGAARLRRFPVIYTLGQISRGGLLSAKAAPLQATRSPRAEAEGALNPLFAQIGGAGLGCELTDDDTRRHGVAAYYTRHNRRIGDAQIFYTVNFEFTVDNG
jgi:hypothetical protein